MLTTLRLTAALIVLAAIVITAQSPGVVTIRAGRLLDGKGGTASNVVVEIENGRIKSVGMRPGAVDYDLSGTTVMPGWIDTHVHIGWHFGPDGRYEARGGTPAQEALYGAENAYVTVMHGFTTVQSVGSPSDVELRGAIARGILPGPRLLTSIRSFSRGTPEELRDAVRKAKADGADVVKLFASESIRTGGKQSMTDEQLQAACGEARAQGLRTLVHAHSAESIRAAALAGCSQVEHGTFADDGVLKLMAEKGTYFDPNVGLVLQNYLENREKFIGIGSYTDEGFASMEKALPVVLDADRVAMLVDDAASRRPPLLTVDLESCTVGPPAGGGFPFAIQEGRRQALLAGLDEIDVTLARRADIDAFQAADRARRPWIYRRSAPDGG